VHLLRFLRGSDAERLPELRGRARGAAASGGDVVSGVRHLYVHVPFCAHRCGYCDFVTVVGRNGSHGAYVEALLAELELERAALAEPLETVYLGGGTPTFTEAGALERLLVSLPPAGELTVEANPETVTPTLARLLAERGVNRVSLGVQSFQPRLLSVLERRSSPDDVRRAVQTLRDANFDNISFDLIYGIPGQSSSDLRRDLEAALALEPEHLSCYELEAKPGTRFTHTFGDELTRQSEALEGYFEDVVETVTGAGYRWYETANFCRQLQLSGGRDLRSRHNLAYWLGRDYLGLGVGAVSTLGSVRRRNTPQLPVYLEALARDAAPPREIEPLAIAVKQRERIMLGLRLDEPLPLAGLEDAVDGDALDRLEALGLAARPRRGTLTLTPRGRFLGGGVTAELLA
jgi:putative oxygen-independent coproporphyrinogen III oxidase